MDQQLKQAKEMGFDPDLIQQAQSNYKQGYDFIELCLEIQNKESKKAAQPNGSSGSAHQNHAGAPQSGGAQYNMQGAGTIENNHYPNEKLQKSYSFISNTPSKQLLAPPPQSKAQLSFTCIYLRGPQQAHQQQQMQGQHPAPTQMQKNGSFQQGSILYEDEYQLHDYIRIAECPIGLVNIGNTCYFNSLIQSYFKNPVFCKMILSYQYPSNFDLSRLQLYIGESKAKRIITSMNLVVHLQRLFSFLLLSDKRFFNPSNVFKNIVNSFGERYRIGEQQDIGEFNLNFLSRIEEGLIYSHQNLPVFQVKWLSNQEQASMIKSDEQQHSQMVPRQQQQSQIDSSSQVVAEEEREKTMQQLFFGQRVQVSTYTEQGKKVESKKSQEFNSIYLQLDCKDLMRAWEESRFSEVDDFKNEKDEIVRSTHSFWISQIPDALLFQINRTCYDISTNTVMKLHSQFHFEKEIYVDRFLEENQQEYQTIKHELEQLREKKSMLTEKLESVRNFNKSTLSIVDIIQMVQSHFENRQTEAAAAVVVSQNSLAQQQSESEEHISARKNNIEIDTDFQRKLEEEKQRCIHEAESYSAELDEIKTKEDMLFETMKKKKYSLQTILIHQGGSAGSGHYFSYVWDFQKQKWIKYDDINCFEVDEVDVLRNARGSGDQSAYALVYVSEVLKKSMETTPYIHQTINPQSKMVQASNIQQQQHPMSIVGAVPTNLREEILKDNRMFAADLQKFEEDGKVQQVIRDYEQRLNSVDTYNKYLNSRKDIDRMNPCLSNFSAFMFHQNQLSLSKLHMLDVSLRSFIGPTYSLHNLLKDQKFMQKIQTQMRNVHFSRQIDQGFTTKEVNHIEILYSEFISYMKLSAGICSAYEDADIQNFDSCLNSIPHLMLVNNLNQPFFKKVLDDILGVILLLYSCMLFDQWRELSGVISEKVKLIARSCKLLPRNLEYIFKQVKINLQEFSKATEKHYDSQTKKAIAESIKILSDSKLENIKDFTSKPHRKLEGIFTEIEEGIENFYCWENVSPFSDVFLNKLVSAQRKFNEKYKLLISIYSFILEKGETFDYKTRLTSKLHGEIKH